MEFSSVKLMEFHYHSGFKKKNTFTVTGLHYLCFDKLNSIYMYVCMKADMHGSMYELYICIYVSMYIHMYYWLTIRK